MGARVFRAKIFMVEKLILQAEKKCTKAFKRAEDIALYNQEKVLKAFFISYKENIRSGVIPKIFSP